MATAKETSLTYSGGTATLSFRERWTRKFAESLTEDEKKAFRLWLDFSEGKISESEFKAKMDMKVMPRMLGKMSAARISALEDEVESLRRRVDALEKKIRKA
jgi:polyhydroxyalkanoate synthesis regulator phasin